LGASAAHGESVRVHRSRRPASAGVYSSAALKVLAGSFATGWADGFKYAMPELGAPVSGPGLGELPGISWTPGRTFNAWIEFMLTTGTLQQVTLQCWITSGDDHN
jgi:hypothetical protein